MGEDDMNDKNLVLRFNDPDFVVAREAKMVKNYASLLSFCDKFLLGELS